MVRCTVGLHMEMAERRRWTVALSHHEAILAGEAHLGPQPPCGECERRGTRRNSWSTGVVWKPERMHGNDGIGQIVLQQENQEYSMPWPNVGESGRQGTGSRVKHRRL